MRKWNREKKLKIENFHEDNFMEDIYIFLWKRKKNQQRHALWLLISKFFLKKKKYGNKSRLDMCISWLTSIYFYLGHVLTNLS